MDLVELVDFLVLLHETNGVSVWTRMKTVANSTTSTSSIMSTRSAKLTAQAKVVKRLAHLKPTVRVKDAKPVSVAASITGWAAELHDGLTFARMRKIESFAGRNYWQTWALVSPSSPTCRKAREHTSPSA